MMTAIPASERDPKRCAWFASSDGLRALLQIQNATELSPMLGQTPKELFGFPIIVSDQIATTSGTPDTSTIYFGNWRGVLVGRRGPGRGSDLAIGAGRTSQNSLNAGNSSPLGRPVSTATPLDDSPCT